jgi:peroxiredoxin
MTFAKPKFRAAVTTLLWISALGVLAENIVLSRQNRRLLQVVSPQITSGTELQMISGLALDGHVEPVSLPSGRSKLLLITFSPGCPACQANQEGWTDLARMLRPKGVRVLWVSRDQIDVTREYCLKHGVPLIDVVADPPYQTYLELGLARVPNTVLVGASGNVEKVWAGQLGPTGWNSVFAYFRERQGTDSAARNQVGPVATACGPQLWDASAKSCK